MNKMHNKKFTTPVSLYNMITLAVLVVCLFSVGFYYSESYISEEKRRAHIAEVQLARFFDFERRTILTELWNESYDAILMRISNIATRSGSTDHTIYVLNKNGNCVASNVNPAELN